MLGVINREFFWKLWTRSRVGCAVVLNFKKLGQCVVWAVAAVLAGGLGSSCLRAAESVVTAPEVLIYADGDRVRGKLVEKSNELWVFQSEKFGLLKVPVEVARVETVAGVLAVTSDVKSPVNSQQAAVVTVAATKPKHEDPDDVEPVGWARFTPMALTQTVREFFGPWKGRFSISVEDVTDASSRNTTLLELHMKRTWKRDEVDGTLRYDFSQTAHVATKDLIKLTGSWRRDYAYKLFSIYRPTSEYNRAFKASDGLAANYMMLQQEIGAGVIVFTTPQRKLRTGLSENLFDVWIVAPYTRHSSQTSESIFAEMEWSLPWRLRLTERGVWYPPFRSGSDGWENRLELNKKLTETLSVAIRHETRTNNPDVRIQDYTLLRLLVGLDF
jgi:hypothetical protein